MAVTQEQIDEAIKNCFWRKDAGGVDVCRGEVAPCMRIIEKGKCDTLKKLFAESEESEDE